MAHPFAVTSGTGVVLAGRYQLGGRIAAGGAGEVWRAVDTVLGRPVAVKLLRAEYAQHPQTVARFRAEARHAGSLSHPGIAQVYDYSDNSPQYPPYLVMELVDGPSLASVLASGPLDAARAMDIAAQAAAGLAAAHAAGLVHRDIKPANLLLGHGGQVKITDFGIAYAAGSAPVTRTGTLVGTPAYLAPERAAGATATAASDLYSLGVVAYECLAGTPPFTGEPLEVAAAHRHRPLPPLPPAVPAGAAALVAELTAKDPAARPRDASEVAARAAHLRDTLAAGATMPLPAGSQPDTRADAQHLTLPGLPAPGPPSVPRWHGAWPTRRVALAAASTVVAAGLVGWLLAGVFGTVPSRHQPAAARTAPAPSTPAVRTVEVNGDALAGQPVPAVRADLLQLGLQARLQWVRSAAQRPGRVVSVQPSGPVPVGSVVTVTAALAPQGHGHGHGGGHGGGDGNGDG